MYRLWLVNSFHRRPSTRPAIRYSISELGRGSGTLKRLSDTIDRAASSPRREKATTSAKASQRRKQSSCTGLAESLKSMSPLFVVSPRMISVQHGVKNSQIVSLDFELFGEVLLAFVCAFFGRSLVCWYPSVAEALAIGCSCELTCYHLIAFPHTCRPFAPHIRSFCTTSTGVQTCPTAISVWLNLSARSSTHELLPHVKTARSHTRQHVRINKKVPNISNCEEIFHMCIRHRHDHNLAEELSARMKLSPRHLYIRPNRLPSRLPSDTMIATMVMRLRILKLLFKAQTLSGGGGGGGVKGHTDPDNSSAPKPTLISRRKALEWY